jgi:hypothetical protein
MPDKEFTKIFFATDLHGSRRCYEELLSVTKFCKPDALVLGGNLKGKHAACC